MIVNMITAIIGVGLLVVFLGIMLIWVPAPPLIIIVVLVLVLLLWDFVQTLRHGEDHAGR